MKKLNRKQKPRGNSRGTEEEMNAYLIPTK